jgi:hypothetical protein
MRTVDLAIYADTLAAEAAALSARLERARSRLRQAAIEHEAEEALPADVVERLRGLGLLDAIAGAPPGESAELEELQRSLAALGQLQSWVEARLFSEREEVTGTYAAARSASPASSAAR